MTEKGLREIVAAQTRISDIDGEQGGSGTWATTSTTSRRTPPSRRSSTCCTTALPDPAELDELHEFLVEEREVSPFLQDLMPTLAQQTSPMSMLRTSVSAASAYDPDGWDDSPEAEYRKAMRLIAKTPTLIATYHRLRTGQEVVPPNTKLPHAANFLYMLLGVEPVRRTPRPSTRRSCCTPTTR